MTTKEILNEEMRLMEDFFDDAGQYTKKADDFYKIKWRRVE